MIKHADSNDNFAKVHAVNFSKISYFRIFIEISDMQNSQFSHGSKHLRELVDLQIFVFLHFYSIISHVLNSPKEYIAAEKIYLKYKTPSALLLIILLSQFHSHTYSSTVTLLIYRSSILDLQ